MQPPAKPVALLPPGPSSAVKPPMANNTAAMIPRRLRLMQSSSARHCSWFDALTANLEGGLINHPCRRQKESQHNANDEQRHDQFDQRSAAALSQARHTVAFPRNNGRKT